MFINRFILNLQEKEKELEIKNIYSNRVVGGRRFPNSYSGTPHDTPPPKPRRRAPSLHDLTPREKMKIYEEKRRLEEKKKQEVRYLIIIKILQNFF